MTTEQPRHPAGSPLGGTWVSPGRPDPGLELPAQGELPTHEHLDEAQENARGTYDFPPAPRSARQAIEFWTKVPISDATLRQVAKDFSRARSVEVNAVQCDAMERFRRSRSLRRELRRQRPAILTATAFAEQETYRERVRQADRIDPHDIRSVLVATRMTEEARSFLPADEYQKVANFHLPMPSMRTPQRPDPQIPAQRIADYFNLRRSLITLQSPEARAFESSQETLAAIDMEAAIRSNRDSMS